MTDTYRCVNAFALGDRVYPGGAEVEEGDDILKTHSAHFVRVATPVAPVVEVTTAEPGERRDLTPPQKAPAKRVPPKKAVPAPSKAVDTGGDADA